MSARTAQPPELAGWLASVSISMSGLEARLRLEAVEAGEDGPPEAPAPPVAALRDLLLREGVSFGVDEAALAEVASSPAGPARVVAHGLPPERGVDGTVVFAFLADSERDPLHTVPVGTHLARRTPPRAGRPGTSVTGEPIPAPPVRNPPLSAGPGAALLSGPAGQTEVFAAVDGRPAQSGGRVTLEQTIVLPSIGVERTNIDLFCSLRLLDGVPEAHRVQVRGRLTVGGMVDRSRLYATEGITVGAGCVSSHLRAGGLDSVHRALSDRLAVIEQRLRALTRECARLVARSAERGRGLRVGQALYALSQGHFSEIEPALRDALDIARGPGAEGLRPDIEGAIASAHATLCGLEAHRIAALDELEALAGRLEAAIESMQATPAGPADMRINYLQRCRVEASGSLVVSGRGMFNCDVWVGGDLVCEHPRGVVRGGRLRVGGAVRTPELGAPSGAPVEVVLGNPEPGPDRLVAARVHEGVKVCLGGVWHTFTEPRRNVRLGLDDQRRIVSRSGSGA